MITSHNVREKNPCAHSEKNVFLQSLIFSFISQFTDYIMRQVNDGKGRLAPGFDPYRIIDNMFSNQDRDGDGKITEAEFKLKADEAAAHDEL